MAYLLVMGESPIQLYIVPDSVLRNPLYCIFIWEDYSRQQKYSLLIFLVFPSAASLWILPWTIFHNILIDFFPPGGYSEQLQWSQSDQQHAFSMQAEGDQTDSVLYTSLDVTFLGGFA